MKKLWKILSGVIMSFALFVTPALAETSSEVIDYTNNTLQIITIISVAAATFFLVKAGYLYITSTGDPNAIASAKKTIRTTLIGLLIVLSANMIISVFRGSLDPATNPETSSLVAFPVLETVEPSEGLTQVLIDAVAGFIQNIVESATQPFVDGIIGFLTTTPRVFENSVVRNFWLVSLGIVDTLFVVVTALIGLQVMSASTFGFEEIELKQLLPKLGIAFLGAHVSLFLADYVIVTCNVLVNTVLNVTGGLNHAWIVDAINPVTVITGTTPLITLIFMVLFLILSIVLLLMYISRLIMIALGAVLSPFIFLLWVLPRFSDVAFVAVKTYIATVFIVFVHVIIIQLASSFLAIPEHSENSLISIAVAIGLFFTLLRTPSLMMQLIVYTSNNGTVKKLSNQIINVITTSSASQTARPATYREALVKVPRKVIHA